MTTRWGAGRELEKSAQRALGKNHHSRVYVTTATKLCRTNY
jgi:hypothetical protein